MATVRELIYYVSDLMKTMSDDSEINENHIAFSLNKYRAYLIKLEEDKDKLKLEQNQSNYMTICLDMEETNAIDADVCGNKTFLRSKQEIPNYYGKLNVFPQNYFLSKYISFVTKQRFMFTGHNKWLKTFTYATIGTDKHLYLTSIDPDILELESLKVSGLFEDYEKAAQLTCPDEDNGQGNKCEPWDNEFPIADYLIPQLIELVLKELLGASYRPSDDLNNANDDMADLAAWIQRNLKNKTQKAMSGDE